MNPLELSDDELRRQLRAETDAALNRIYQLQQPTPCSTVTLDAGCPLLLKREDLSRVHSYKWRGAANKIGAMDEAGFDGALVAASAGNHAQGVAIVARQLGLKATIFMPLTTPLLKQKSVQRFGGEYVEIRLRGDSYDESAAAAAHFATESGGAIIPPYDDLLVIAGQSTIGVEISQFVQNAPTHAFLEIGGGGMAAGVASVLRDLFPDIRIIGVEAEGQDCMGISVAAGSRQTLTEIDRFCDGTAVATPGAVTFRLCEMLIDEFVTVSNDEVCQAIQYLWQELRIIVEPSAGIGVAAARKYALQSTDRPVTVLSGSNVDFSLLPKIAKRGQPDRPAERYFAFEIGERPGELIRLLDQFFGNMNIIDFQYGKVADDHAFPVIGIEVPQSSIDQLNVFLSSDQVPPYKELTGTALSVFRVIPFRADNLSHPWFATVTFSNRPGALRDFMRGVSKWANVCYMNYTDTGQTEGQALLGFEFDAPDGQNLFIGWLKETGIEFEPIDMDTIRHFMPANNDGDSWKTMSAGFVRRQL